MGIMERRKFIHGAGVTSAIALAGCAGQLESLTGPSVEEVKNESKSISHDELYRNNSEHDGEYVHYSKVELFDILDREGTKEYILTFPRGSRYSGTLYGYWDGDPFKRSDIIEIWGIVDGLKTYNSLGGEKTVPQIELVDIELVRG